MATITLENLRHSYLAHPASDADWALKQLDVEWQDGGAYALLGPSGCGKTTLLNIISGLLRPSQGRVLFDGQDVTDLPPDQRHIAQVFQFPVIYDTMTRLRQSGLPAAQSRRRRGRCRCPGAADRGAAGADRDAEEPRCGPHRRQQAENLARPRPGALRRQRHHVRRAAHRHRSASEVGAALEAEGAAPGADAHHDLRHPRPDRGADDRRSGGGHGPGRGRADRHAGRAVRGAQAHLRRPFHRLAGHERPAVRARERPADDRRPQGRDRQWRRRARGGRPARDRRAARVRQLRRRTALPSTS